MSKWLAGLCATVIAFVALSIGGVALAQSGLTASLTGAAEKGGGDADGTGSATVTLTSDTELSYTLDVTGITLPAAAAHIHKGAAGVNGPVVVPFPAAPDASGKASGTATVDAALIADIRANPQNYYVNVHNADYPDGAMRGQLGGAGAPTTLPTTGASDGVTTKLVLLALLLLAVGFTVTMRLRSSRGVSDDPVTRRQDADLSGSLNKAMSASWHRLRQPDEPVAAACRTPAGRASLHVRG